MTELLLTNAQLVLSDRVVRGTLRAQDGQIRDIDESQTTVSDAIDCGGDYVLPGLVELHSDNMEKHFAPRPGVQWPELSAAIAHDAQMAAAGITTVFDALRVGDSFRQAENRGDRFLRMAHAIRDARDNDTFRADHKIHIRCELCHADVIQSFEKLSAEPEVCLVSLMDHTPGQRQFVDIGKFAEYYQGKYGLTDNELADYMRDLKWAHEEYSPPNRERLVEICHGRNLPLASHDDATVEHVLEAADAGVVIAEFPTTREAAAAAREKGLAILMGAPNLVLGGSHSGNVSALDLARDGNLDVLSSDYVPVSLLHGVFLLTESAAEISLPEAVTKASKNPAASVKLDDRGEIAIGKRADLIRVRKKGSMPVVTSLWRGGERVL
ncbi:MAG: alpha-D-ribose 1-methylphosphonate 5-triphosphate diphosphatase [Alphaproteobacteria bacterium]|nr:alpha-D-ribose 1-methylphosphonate 5-triphosphate diphosphatase [Alphaproteobacteria bacterium]